MTSNYANAACFEEMNQPSDCRLESGDKWCIENRVGKTYAYNDKCLKSKKVTTNPAGIAINEKLNELANTDALMYKLKEVASAEHTFNKALDYFEGVGVKKNPEMARQLYEISANKGYIPAIINLALMHDLGEGIPVNKKIAFKWYMKAATRNHTNAQFNIGNMYYLGSGTEKNTNKALLWYKKAAKQGHEKAAKNVSILSRKTDTSCNSHPLYKTYVFGYNKQKNQEYDSLSSQQNMSLECVYSLDGAETLSVHQIGCHIGWEHSSNNIRKLSCGVFLNNLRKQYGSNF